MMSSIFNISERLIQAYELSLSSDIDAETITTTIEGIQWELEEKADNYANYIAEIKGGIDVIDKEISRLQSLKKSKENFIQTLKDNLYKSMVWTGNKKIKTPLHSFWVQENPPALVVKDKTKIPTEYYIPQPDELDTTSLKNDLLNGEIIEGAEISRGEGVRFR